jgi:gamma-glutamyltranspeptidase/glutathione hydrolase
MGTRPAAAAAPASLLALLALLAACGNAALPPPPAPVAPAPTAAPGSDAAKPVADAAVDAGPPRPEGRIPDGWPYAMHAEGSPSPGGVVASDAALGTRVGVDMLAAGGNAADAAVAVAFALSVVYPAAGNVGGGGFAVARIGAESRALDFRETAPAAATRDMYVDPTGKNTGGAHDGYRSSGVPGSVAGLFELHRTLGSKKKSWADVIAPAIKLAEEGFAVDEGFVESLGYMGDRLKKSPASAALFYPNGEALKVGDTWKNPALAAVLKRIAAKGPPGFYEGPTAVAIVADMKAGGGLVTAADLKAYTAKWRTPLVFQYRGHTVTSMPPPSSGGVTLAMISHIVERYDLPSMPWHGAEELHYVFEAMRRSFAARNAKLGDPDFVKNPLDELLSPAWAAAQAKTILPDHATPSADIPSAAPSGTGPHTTHFSVVDAKGNAVALTTTLNWWYGSGVAIPGTGFLMNNEMDDFASVPGSANGFGLVQGEPNAIAPRKRMLSSMSPTIVTDPAGHVELVTGAAGGPMIISTVFHVLSNVIDYHMDPVAALGAPRFHMQHLPDVVSYEKGGLTPELEARLTAMGYAFKDRGHIADAMAIGAGTGGFLGAAEPRRKGSLSLSPTATAH